MTTLDALSTQYGIQKSAIDARGEELITSAHTKLTMLAAMGVDASAESSALAALRALEEAEWDSPIPPVLVAYAGVQPIQVPVIRPQGSGVLHWLLTLEDGSQRCGECDFGSLHLMEEANVRGLHLEKRLLAIPGRLPWGYHKFWLASEPMELSLIVTPGKCWLPDSASVGKRYWGVAAQLYLLRSQHNWGIGDFTDLKRLGRVHTT